MTSQDPRTAAIDHVARAMTAGAPGADFADRVMAPIYGRPRRDFVARVMAGIDAAPAPAGRVTAAWIYGPALAAAAVAIAALAVLWPRLHSLPEMPAAPALLEMAAEPRIATAAPVTVREAQPLNHGRARVGSRAIAGRGPDAPAAARLLSQIDPLDVPAAIDVEAIEPAATPVAPLAPPAPLTIPGLRFIKEKQ